MIMPSTMGLFGSTVLLLLLEKEGSAQATCFNSTLAIFQAQAMDERADDVAKEYIICPNTVIPIGLPANPQFSEFANGDFPLVISRDNVSILCGEDGSSSNNCTLSGGLGHITAQANFAPFGIANATINNLLLKGLTFTGEMTSVPGVAAFSIAVSAPGRNVRIEDCHWSEVTGIENLLVFGQSSLGIPGDFPADTGDITMRDCSINAIEYDLGFVNEDEGEFAIALFAVANQALVIESSTFNDVKHIRQDGAIATTPSFLVVSVGASGNVKVKDSCFDDISFTGAFMGETSSESIPRVGSIQTENLYLGPSGLTVAPATFTFGERCLGVATNSIPNNGVYENCAEAFTSETCVATAVATSGDPEDAIGKDTSGACLTGLVFSLTFLVSWAMIMP